MIKNDTNKISDQDMAIIYRVAKIHGFEVSIDPDLNKLTVVGFYQHSHENFYWSSDKTFEDFFTDLQKFFMTEGAEMYR